MIARIPDPPLPSPDCTVEQYGMRLFQHVLSDGCHLATMSDEQVELAAYAGTRVIACPRDTYSELVYARLCDCHRLISGTVRRRATLPRAPIGMPAGVTPHTPNAGPMAPLSPVPSTRPPSGTHADVDSWIIDHDHSRVDRVQF